MCYLLTLHQGHRNINAVAKFNLFVIEVSKYYSLVINNFDYREQIIKTVSVIFIK